MSQAGDPQAGSLNNVHWNSTRSALCGDVQGMAFIASGDQATVDGSGETEHAAFTAMAGTIDCSP